MDHRQRAHECIFGSGEAQGSREADLNARDMNRKNVASVEIYFRRERGELSIAPKPNAQTNEKHCGTDRVMIWGGRSFR